MTDVLEGKGEWYRNEWHTIDEIEFANKMFKKRKGDLYEKSLLVRDIWSGDRLDIDKIALMHHIETLKGGNGGCQQSG